MTTQQFMGTISNTISNTTITTDSQARSRTLVSILLPFDPNAVWGNKARHHIRGTINGQMIRGELESADEGYFIVLGAAWRRDTRIKVGATVEVTLFPEEPHSGSVADDIARAFDTAPQATAFFDALPTFYRKNYIRWIESAKRDATRAKRIAEMIDLLNAEQRER